METNNQKMITIKTHINAPVEKVWQYWSDPEHIKKWNSASDDWHTPSAENDLRTGGSFSSRMESRDGTMGFDFGGIYDLVKPFEDIQYTMADKRKVVVKFEKKDEGTDITESFDPEESNSPEFQKAGWQSILDNFKKYTEQN